jgi:predicted phage tail protein
VSIKDELIGAKGGGGSFKNTPDNLRSTDTFEALIGLTSGRIKGLAPGGLRNLFVDDIPIEDGSGNTNLSEFVATLFDGDPTILRPVQLLLGGSSGASGINLPVNNPNTNGQPGEWRNGTVSQIGVDFIDLRFIVNQLYQQDKKGIYESRALLEINLQPSGSTEWINPLGSGTPPQEYPQFRCGMRKRKPTLARLGTARLKKLSGHVALPFR